MNNCCCQDDGKTMSLPSFNHGKRRIRSFGFCIRVKFVLSFISIFLTDATLCVNNTSCKVCRSHYILAQTFITSKDGVRSTFWFN